MKTNGKRERAREAELFRVTGKNAEQRREERVREKHARGDWINPAAREEYGLPSNQAVGG